VLTPSAPGRRNGRHRRSRLAALVRRERLRRTSIGGYARTPQPARAAPWGCGLRLLVLPALWALLLADDVNLIACRRLPAVRRCRGSGLVMQCSSERGMISSSALATAFRPRWQRTAFGDALASTRMGARVQARSDPSGGPLSSCPRRCGRYSRTSQTTGCCSLYSAGRCGCLAGARRLSGPWRAGSVRRTAHLPSRGGGGPAAGRRGQSP
jgi:hypothetical protein